MERARPNIRNPGTAQFFVPIDEDACKYPALCSLLDALPAAQWIIYCCDRSSVARLTEPLEARTHNAIRDISAFHAEIDHEERASILDRFHSGELRILVITDNVSPRFLGDIVPAPLIVNYDFPPVLEDFAHRAFRTGRFGSRAVTVSLVLSKELQHLRDVERFFSIDVRELCLSQGAERIQAACVTSQDQMCLSTELNRPQLACLKDLADLNNAQGHADKNDG